LTLQRERWESKSFKMLKYGRLAIVAGDGEERVCAKDFPICDRNMKVVEHERMSYGPEAAQRHFQLGRGELGCEFDE
ncbi:MAG: hypothetical protein WBL63_26675, partial [Candidatus Acidiferrum sp.]